MGARRRPSGSSRRSRERCERRPARELPRPERSNHRPPAEADLVPGDRADRLLEVSEARDPGAIALRGAGVSLQRGHVRPGHAAHHVLRCRARAPSPIFFAIFAPGNFLGPLVLGRLFDTMGRRPMITISYLGSATRPRRARPPRAGWGPHEVGFLAHRGGHLLPRLRGGELGLSDGERDLPDGDACARDRVLLCGRHGDRRHHRPAALRTSDQDGDTGQLALAS